MLSLSLVSFLSCFALFLGSRLFTMMFVFCLLDTYLVVPGPRGFAWYSPHLQCLACIPRLRRTVVYPAPPKLGFHVVVILPYGPGLVAFTFPTSIRLQADIPH